MGGYNSGRPRKRTGYLSHCLFLDLKNIKTHLGITGAKATCTWTNGSNMGVSFLPNSVLLSYQAKGQDYSQEVPIATTPCNYGKSRPWFVCACSRRTTKLYLVGRMEFVCRKCTGLAYRSKSLAPEDRLLATIRTLQAKIDPKGSHDQYDIPERPTGMHQTTYDHITGKLEKAIEKRGEILDAHLAGVLNRVKGLREMLEGTPWEKPKKDFWA